MSRGRCGRGIGGPVSLHIDFNQSGQGRFAPHKYLALCFVFRKTGKIITLRRLTVIGAHCQASPRRSSAIAMAKPEEQSKNKIFGGWNRRYKHKSDVLGCDMTFSVYYPPAAEQKPVPVLYYLSGLTCDDTNATTKGCPQRAAAQHGVAFVAPDTSPRGLGIEGEDESWDFGTGAGFYLNATQSKWKQYRMYDYIVKELPAVLGNLQNLDLSKACICGHSMGGHGALVLGLRNPDKYRSISAFSAICNPVNAPWGKKAFSGYLGDDKESWKQYDATELAQSYSGPEKDIMLYIGTGDNFLKDQLMPEALEKAASGNKLLNLDLKMQPDYDHSYFFMSTFFDEHIAFHAKHL